MGSKPLMALTAADIMSSVVISIPRQMSLHGAAHLLSQNAITGAPVVDEVGRCIGVLSATDFVHLAEQNDFAMSPCRQEAYYCSDWQFGPVESASQATVESVMTHAPVTAMEGASMAELADLMLNHHIHRVVIVDEQERPVGIVSAMDILAAVARGERAQVAWRELAGSKLH